MSAWDECRALERASRQHLRVHVFPTLAFEGRYVHVEKGEMARQFQATQGDYVVNSDDDAAWRVEHKCEYSNGHGNFFVETFSNHTTGNPGWFWKLEADFLLYHFMRDGHVFLMSLRALRSWLYSQDPNRRPNTPIIHRYPHKAQVTHQQKNVTTAYCVNIEHVCGAIKVRRISVPVLVLPERERAA